MTSRSRRGKREIERQSQETRRQKRKDSREGEESKESKNREVERRIVDLLAFSVVVRVPLSSDEVRTSVKTRTGNEKGLSSPTLPASCSFSPSTPFAESVPYRSDPF